MPTTDPDALANFFRDRTTDVTAPTTRATLTARPLEGVSLTARVVYVDYDISGSLDEVVDAVGSDPAASTIFGHDEGHAFLFDATQDVRVIVQFRRVEVAQETADLHLAHAALDDVGVEEALAIRGRLRAEDALGQPLQERAREPHRVRHPALRQRRVDVHSCDRNHREVR